MKTLEKTNAHLFCSYNIILSLLNQFELIVEHGKLEVFHFSRSYGLFNPSLLNLSPIGDSCFQSKDTWKYLEFIFDRRGMLIISLFIIYLWKI